MSLRAIEVVVPSSHRESIRAAIEDMQVCEIWEARLQDERSFFRLILRADQSGPLLDRLEAGLGEDDGSRILVLPAEATLPALPVEEQEAEAEPAPAAADKKPEKKKAEIISRAELVEDLEAATRTTRIYLLMVLLAAIVASIGLVRDDVALLVGAMVIAPLLGPNMALALGVTLGDRDWIRRAAKTGLTGIGLALLFAIVVGLLFEVDTGIGAIAARTEVRLGDLALALAAGVAGTLAYTRGVSDAVVGVMVAVALMPPLVVSGLLFGEGEIELGLRALLLVATNVICLNLAGVLTFRWLGIRPRTWWEADKANKATRFATRLLIGLIAILILLLAFNLL